MKIKQPSKADIRDMYLRMLTREIRNTYTMDDAR